MPAPYSSRRRVELVIVPLIAAFCMALIVSVIVLDKDARNCPPANWHNQVTLTLTGNQESVAEVSAITACTGLKCHPLNPAFAKSAANAANILAHPDKSSWVLSVGTQPPSSITLRAYDSAGNVLAQQSNSFNWTRIGGNEQCGGPMAEMKLPFQLP